ncbi:MAG TPA: hypothetical protein VK557_02280 [Pyrinomonadaceae bacterium]|nr:hypothetical protein [Pyrinomonadaceae bacterium]
MREIRIGDRVHIKGDTQDYILVDPDKVYKGEVIGKDGGQLLVKLDEPVMRGTVEFPEVNVRETNALLSEPK